jgi:hypothetical protein
VWQGFLDRFGLARDGLEISGSRRIGWRSRQRDAVRRSPAEGPDARFPGQRSLRSADPGDPGGATLGAGSLLTREWNGKLERVMVLEKGFAWNGKSYGSLSQIAKAMTGTSWSGHRFFGLRAANSGPSARAPAGKIAVAHPEECGRDAATSP